MFHGLAGPDRSENTRTYFELCSQLGKLASGRPEAKCSIHPFRFLPRQKHIRIPKYNSSSPAVVYQHPPIGIFKSSDASSLTVREQLFANTCSRTHMCSQTGPRSQNSSKRSPTNSSPTGCVREQAFANRACSRTAPRQPKVSQTNINYQFANRLCS